MMRASRGTRLTRTILCLLAAAWLPAAAGAASQEIKPALPGDTVFGLKLVDWAEALAQWSVSIPASVNPRDPTGLYGGVGQRAPVWFIKSALPNSGTQDYAIPDGKAILLSVGSLVHEGKPGEMTEDQLAVDPTTQADQVTTLEVSLDGVPVANPKQYRVRTPVFDITIPPNNVFGESVSTVEEERRAAVTDGYWFLFPPLPVGHHVLTRHVVGTTVDGIAYDTQWTFKLNIEKPNEASQ
jgi:hypothetical protein